MRSCFGGQIRPVWLLFKVSVEEKFSEKRAGLKTPTIRKSRNFSSSHSRDQGCWINAKTCKNGFKGPQWDLGGCMTSNQKTSYLLDHL